MQEEEELQQTLNESQEPSEPEPKNDGVAEPTPQQESQGQALDPNLYDEDGVPWKNRAKEYQRKYSDSVQQVRNFEQQQAINLQQQKPQDNDPYSEILNAQDPKKQLEMIEKRIVSQIKTEMFNTERQKSLQRAFSKHSDLNDRNSDFFKAVDDEIRYMTSIGLDMNKSPNVVETVADRVAKKFSQNNGNRQTPQQPNNLPVIGTTSSKQPKPINNNDLPQMPNAMNNALNSVRFMTPEDRKIIEKRIRERQARGEFSVIGEGNANRGM